MHLPCYEIFQKNNDSSEYRFISIGPNGDITKVILFQSMPIEGLYNLSLLDVIEDDILSDSNVSNNNDLPKILATTINVIVDYTRIYPERAILFQGSDTGRRNALYKRVIERYFNILQTEFTILGITEDNTKEPFDKSKDYTAFLVMRK